jgi:hypothetical protein
MFFDMKSTLKNNHNHTLNMVEKKYKTSTTNKPRKCEKKNKLVQNKNVLLFFNHSVTIYSCGRKVFL